MKIIHKLSPELIAQIAAGEVIERPAYAVKELIDNSIDAHATSIEITLKDYGLKNITITDNGVGMSRDDLLDCWKIHTTSKVSNSNSLLAISSLGFRGEALASITAVSDVTIQSRQNAELGGYQIKLKNGKLLSNQPVGMPVGTTIEVNNIFSSIPGRRKFLKSGLSEYRLILDVFLSFALAFPKLSFKLIHNGKKIYDIEPSTTQEQRINLLIDKDTSLHLLPIKSDHSYISFSGFLGTPQVSLRSSTKQFIFVNGRRITDRLITQALKDAYGTLLDSKSHPLCYVFIDIPFELVDVNVHPRKEQLAFLNTQLLYDTIYQTVKEFLNQNNLTFNNMRFKREEVTDLLTGKVLKSATTMWQAKQKPLKIDYKEVSQLNEVFILVPTNQGLLLLDQHACHERILFEKFKFEFSKQKKRTIKLAKPISLKLSQIESALLEEYLEDFQSLGLNIDLKNQEILGIPVLFKDRDIKQLIHEVLNDLEIQGRVSDIDAVSLTIIKYLSCKNAIKAGDKLTKAEMANLIKKLEKVADNYSCPHGRPTKIEISTSELNKWFKRS